MAKTETKSMKQQVELLATNLEILNQKLNKDPDAAFSKNEASLKESVDEIHESMSQIKNMIKSSESYNNIKTEKEDLSNEVERLRTVVRTLGKYDKDWINSVLEEIRAFQMTGEQLNMAIKAYYEHTDRLLDTHQAQVTKKVYNKLFKALKKDNLIMMMFTSILSSTVALVILMVLLLVVR